MPAPARTDPKSQRDRQMSLKILLIVPFVSQVILAVGITGWLSVQNGREATQELAPKIGQEVTNTIEAHVRGYFDAPLEILQSYGAMARADYLNFENLNSLNNIFWQQMRQAQSLYFFYAANPQGQFIGVERREGNALILHQSLLPNSSASLQKLIYQLDNSGKVLKQIEANIYDPRDR
ncbi:MAG: hypothetical protein IM556_00435, partial [Pseudanabaena sp. M110S1SP2A07QC]|nr:hypothetical protein [Pseudanabaena sp. M110S1SP2A07QC]